MKRRANPLFVVLLLVTSFIVIASSLPLPANAAATISLSPPNGPSGTVVTVTGSGFAGGDSTCTITATGPSTGLVTAATACTITTGSIDPGVTFTVGPGVSPGSYTVKVTGNTGDSATASFKLIQPTIILTPQSGPVNTVVSVKSGGVKFSLGDTSCIISSPTLIFTGTPACTISNGAVTGSFQVGVNPSGPYEIDVTGSPSTAVASAIFTVSSTTTVISVTPTDGPFKTKVTVQGSGFSTSDTSCQITASPDGTTIAASPAPTCTAGSGKISGVFYVGLSEAVNTLETITVTGTPGGDSASVSFTIDGSPQITFTPPSPQPPGTTVTVSLSAGQFSSGDTTGGSVTCSISSSPGSLFQSSACRIGSGGTDLTGTFFVVANVASGSTYTVTVKGTLGDTASAVFTVAAPVSGPAIFLSPSDGPIRTDVSVTGTGFPSLDSSCVLSASATLFAGSPAPTCSISGGKITASFTVATGASPGSVTVTVTSSSGASASETFVVDATPTLAFTPGSPQPPGTTIQVSIAGGAFSTGDSSSCTISSSPGGLFQSSACFLTQGPPQSLAGTFFVVANVPAGSTYLVTVRGSRGDIGSGSFTVAPPPTGPQLITVPSDGPRGTKITIQGTAFSGTDTSCIITSAPANIISSPTCSVTNKGVVSGSFIVASGADPSLNPYTILVTGSSGDVGTASFRVDPTPTLTFSPAPPQTPGVTVQVGIAISIPQGQFSSGDTSCSLSSSPSGLFASSNCHIGGAGTDLTGTFFVVAGVVSGNSYTVTVTGNLGDTGVGVFQVVVAPSLTLTPSFGSPGASIAFVARGLTITDSSCSVTSNTGVNGATLIASPSCTSGGGTATGTFTVAATATADSTWTVTVTGNPAGDTVTASFTLVPTISVTPENGVASSVVALSGFGFSSGATTCTVSSSPGGAMPNAFFVNPGCNLQVPGPSGNGRVMGTFTVAAAAPAGAYVITVTDSALFAASTTFTVGSPNANVTLNPNTVTPPQSGSVAVGITGFGFNGGDNVCTITVSAPITGTCTISGGTAGGTISVPAGTPAGLYLVTITGNTGDFASNYLGVNAITTATSTTATTSQTTTVTTTSTTSTTTGISTSFSTTTQQTTGFSTWLFTSGTLTTTFAQSTAYVVTTTMTTFTSLFTTTVTAVTTHTSTIGYVIQPAIQTNGATDIFGLLALLSIGISMLLKRRVR